MDPMSTSALPFEHDAPAEAFAVAAPLVPQTEEPRRRTPAEEARTLVSAATLGTLSTLSGGDPWGSMVGYGVTDDGAPVLLVSTLAEHGRNLLADPRASVVVTESGYDGDPLDSGRVTLAGKCFRPEGEALEAANAAFVRAVPTAAYYLDFGDFATWVLEVDRVRWVGGYGRMDSADADSYRAAEPDPVAKAAPYAVKHLNEDHADALLAMAQVLAGFTDATAAQCKRADRYGLDLWVTTPRGKGPARVGFAEPIAAPDGLRAATVELARRSRT
jgi:putative heme iron utilization protein